MPRCLAPRAGLLIVPALLNLAGPTDPPPVSGGSTADGTPAPILTPGRYTDMIPGQRGQVARTYRLRRAPGTSIYVSAHVRGAVSERSSAEMDTLTLRTRAGDLCTESSLWWDGDAPDGFGAVAIDAGEELRSVQHPSCRSAAELVVTLTRGDREHGTTGADVPVTLKVVEEPAVRDYDRLPPCLGTGRVEHDDAGGGAPTSTTTSTEADRPVTMRAGSWSTALPVDDTVFYRVRLDWGQSAALTVRPEGTPEVLLTTQVVSPGGQVLPAPDDPTHPASATARVGEPHPMYVSATVPQVRYLNRRGKVGVEGASMPGYYLIAATTRSAGGHPKARPTSIPARLDLTVAGGPTGGPAYIAAPSGGAPTTTPEPWLYPSSPAIEATPVPAPSQTAPTTERVEAGGTRRPGSLALGGLAALSLALACAGAVVWRRQRRP